MNIFRYRDDGAFDVELSRDQWAIVDGADLALVMNRKWYAHPNAMNGYYAALSQKERPKTLYMHRVILSAPEGRTTDHLNHNTLDNRRINLRLGGQSENLLNRKGTNTNSTTKVRGLYYHRVKDRWYWNIRIELNGKSRTRNFPPTEEGKAEAVITLEGWHVNPESAFSEPRTRQYIKTRPGRWEKDTS